MAKLKLEEDFIELEKWIREYFQRTERYLVTQEEKAREITVKVKEALKK